MGSMLGNQGGGKLLAKNEITNPELLRLFDQVLKSTAQPEIRTRDRRGSVPRTFTAVKAVQVMNASNWTAYLKRRDTIAQECRRIGARHDLTHWRDHLNGPIMCMNHLKGRNAALADAPALLTEANEVWLLHGTTHGAAEGITNEDFDMTRASPAGLF